MARGVVRMVRDNCEGWVAGGRVPERNQPATHMNEELMEVMVKMVGRQVFKDGRTVKHGGHVVRELVVDGHKLEVETCDRGFGRRLWIDDVQVGTL